MLHAISVLPTPLKCFTSYGRLVYKRVLSGGCAAASNIKSVNLLPNSSPASSPNPLAQQPCHFCENRLLWASADKDSRKFLHPSFTDHSSHRAGMFAITAVEFTTEGTANILVNRYIPLWVCPSTIHPIIRQILRPNRNRRVQTPRHTLLTTNAYHPSGNGDVERVDRTMAQILVMVCKEN